MSNLLNEINARIAAELADDALGLSDATLAALKRSSQGKRVKITAAQKAELIAADIFSEDTGYGHGYHDRGSVQIVLSSKNVLFPL